jgi:hypothetical protein
MANKPNGTVLDIRGRDAEQAELAIEFEKATCRWRILGDAAEVHLSEQQSKILAALRQEGEPLGAADLEKITEIKRDTLGKAHERVRVRAGSISFFDPLSCGIGIRAWVRSGTSRKSVVLSGGSRLLFCLSNLDRSKKALSTALAGAGASRRTQSTVDVRVGCSSLPPFMGDLW